MTDFNFDKRQNVSPGAAPDTSYDIALGKYNIRALRSLWKEAFGDSDNFLDDFFHTAFGYGRCHCIHHEGKVLSALYWFPCRYQNKHIAYIYAVATAKEYRGRGLCRELMKYTHLRLSALKYDGTILVPGNRELFEIYRKLGYEPCCHRKEFVCLLPENTKLSPNFSITPISKETFARLRPDYLPAGSVIQEGVNLNFLETQAAFYAGKDFLLVASRDDASQTLHGIEFLGNINTAPQILKALDCTSGSFRAPVNTDALQNSDFSHGTPYAMFKPGIFEPLPPPNYFGFPFD